MQEIASLGPAKDDTPWKPDARYGFRNRDGLPKVNLALSLFMRESLKDRTTGALAPGPIVVRSDFVTL
jgi:hypothetical protein